MSEQPSAVCQVERLVNHTGEIERLAGIVDDFCDRHGGSSELAFKLNLALDEVLTNIIDYAYDDGAEHTIEVILSADAEVIGAEVVDDGRPHDPLQAEEPDITLGVDERPVGGLGIFFVKQMMDHTGYRYHDGRNRLFFARRRDRRDSPGTQD